jgi:hypothetical protein
MLGPINMEFRKEGWTYPIMDRFFPLQFEIKKNIKNIFNFSSENFVHNITKLIPLILYSVKSGEMLGLQLKWASLLLK